MIIEKCKRYFNSIDDLSEPNTFAKVSTLYNMITSCIILSLIVCVTIILVILPIFLITISLNHSGVVTSDLVNTLRYIIMLSPTVTLPVFSVSLILTIKKSREGYGRYLKMCGFETISEDSNGKFTLK